jgi:hypothetical protein
MPAANPTNFEALRLAEILAAVIGACAPQSNAWRMRNINFSKRILITRLFISNAWGASGLAE